MIETILTSVITTLITVFLIEYTVAQKAKRINFNDEIYYDDMDGITLSEEVFDYLDDLQENGELEEFDNLYALAEKIHSEIDNDSTVDEVVSIIEEWKHLQRNE